MPTTWPGATNTAISAVRVPGPQPTSSTDMPGDRRSSRLGWLLARVRAAMIPAALGMASAGWPRFTCAFAARVRRAPTWTRRRSGRVGVTAVARSMRRRDDGVARRGLRDHVVVVGGHGARHPDGAQESAIGHERHSALAEHELVAPQPRDVAGEELARAEARLEVERRRPEGGRGVGLGAGDLRRHPERPIMRWQATRCPASSTT